jgi:hypothetical protein
MAYLPFFLVSGFFSVFLAVPHLPQDILILVAESIFLHLMIFHSEQAGLVLYPDPSILLQITEITPCYI